MKLGAGVGDDEGNGSGEGALVVSTLRRLGAEVGTSGTATVASEDETSKEFKVGTISTGEDGSGVGVEEFSIVYNCLRRLW